MQFSIFIMKTVRIKVHGRVQGVFFRKYTQGKANELGVKGFVRNAPDGTVEIDATASPETLAAFVNWCHHGPERAVVNKVEVTESPLKNFTSFEITR
jgi:acylphosphatase